MNKDGLSSISEFSQKIVRVCGESTGKITLSTPSNNAINVSLRPTLSWKRVSAAVGYPCGEGNVDKSELTLEIATDDKMENVVLKETLSMGKTSFALSEPLKTAEKYFIIFSSVSFG